MPRPRAVASRRTAVRTPAVRVRAATLADVPALVALETRCFRTDLLSRRQLRQHVHNPRAALLVAAQGGRPLGSALVFFRAGSGAARLYSIAVSPDARGQGLGARLLAAAERAARGRHCVRLRLEVNQRNRAAIALYEARGYRRFGALPGYYEDGSDAWRYEKPLADVPASSARQRQPQL